MNAAVRRPVTTTRATQSHNCSVSSLNQAHVLGMAMQLGLCNRFHFGCRGPDRWR